ncbi:MAG: beta-xylosidase family glycoside hydrolase [Limisphaerales bacterium]
MSRVLYLACTAAFVLTLRSAEPLFSDDFKGDLKSGWTWVREDKAAWRTTKDGLEIRIQRGNMWGPENSGKNVLVRELPKTEKPLEISVTVEHDPTEQYEQVDLVAYYDDSHMVKIGEELVDGKLSIVMGREEKDRARTIAIIPLEKKRVELKLRIDGQQVSGLFKPEGATEWKKAGECDLPGQGRPKIALQCYQGSDQIEHWARIQRFRVSAVE